MTEQPKDGGAAIFEIEMVGAIDTIDAHGNPEKTTLGALLSGDIAAIQWAGQNIFSQVILLRKSDYDAMIAAREATQ